jgi:UPF0755 protein
MKKSLVFFAIIILLVIALYIWWNRGLSPVNPKDTSHKSFIIPKGAALRTITNDLKEQGFIKDPVVFFLLVKQEGLDKEIQAGNFLISPSMNAREIAELLTTGVMDVWVTVPEGKRTEEIGEILKESLPSYDQSWDEILVQNEGYLFPDTYLIPRDATVEQVVQIMRNNFDAKYEMVDVSNTQYSQEEIVTIASLVEREAKHDEDRPLIASVIENRLDNGIALQIDATIQYAKGVPGKWWAPVTLAEYDSVQSPYNTYLQPGLPPGPIANPGIEALEAAANPADTNYLYYISDQNGINRYASTLDGHNENIRRYGL